MMIEPYDKHVSPDVANKLLIEAGFDWKCRKCYNKGVLFDVETDEIRAQTPRHSFYDVLAPTLEVAQRWLREIHHLHITIFSSSQESWMFRITEPHQQLEDGLYGEDFYTYEEAQEAGIKEAVKIVIERKSKRDDKVD